MTTFEIGGRYVVRKFFLSSLHEVTVTELSPSLQLVKFNGKGWDRADDWEIVERLADPANDARSEDKP